MLYDLDLEAGTYFSKEHGYGRVTEMFDLDGDDTAFPEECACAIIYLGPGRWLTLPVDGLIQVRELAS